MMVKRTEILCISLTLLFVLVSSVWAESNWAPSGESDLYNINPGNVGIGTASPAGALHVFRGNPTKFIIGHDESGGQVARAAMIEKQTSSPYHTDFYWSNNPTSNAGDLTFYSSRNTPRVIFKANGNVGVGTTNPAGALHVFRGNPTMLFIGHDESGGQVARAAVIEKQTSSPYHIDFYWSNNPTSNAGDLTFYSSRNTPRVMFKANGNVGIGTTKPGRSLEIISPIGTKTAYWKSGSNDASSTFLIRNSDSTDLFDLDADGDLYLKGSVGIGTTNPAGAFHIFRGNPTKLYVGHDESGGQVARAAVIEKQTSSPYHIDFYWSNNPTSNAGDLTFYSSRNTPRVMFKANGNVGIGTTNPQDKLTVNGTIAAKEIKVESGWSDFVFDADYDLASLDEVETFLGENKHLPGIPSAKEVEQQGLAISEMLAKQMQKIEEMTLYLINMKKENDQLKKRVAVLEGTMKARVK